MAGSFIFRAQGRIYMIGADIWAAASATDRMMGARVRSASRFRLRRFY